MLCFYVGIMMGFGIMMIFLVFFFLCLILDICVCGCVCIRASSVCRKWKQAVKQSLGRRQSLSFAGWQMDDDSIARLLHDAYGLKELDMYVSFSPLLLFFFFKFPAVGIHGNLRHNPSYKY